MTLWTRICWGFGAAAALAACSSQPKTPPNPQQAQTPSIKIPIEGDDPFFSDANSEPLITWRPANGLLHVALVRLLGDQTYEVLKEDVRSIQLVPLDRFLESNPKRFGGEGDYLIVTNVRGEQLYLRREDIAKYKPIIVIGINEHKNLLRFSTTYRLNREYTWRANSTAGNTPPPPMTRPLGAFLFFPDGAPPEIEDTTTASFSLTPASFHFVKSDPLTPIRSLSPELQNALAGGDGCLKCHSFRGAGAHAHHVRASDGKPHGGFALPFEEYPRDVLERFLFNQETVAESFGVSPLHVDPIVARSLFELVRARPNGEEKNQK